MKKLLCGLVLCLAISALGQGIATRANNGVATNISLYGAPTSYGPVEVLHQLTGTDPVADLTAREIRLSPRTNQGSWTINSGSGAANSDGSYDETFNIGFNYRPIGGRYDTSSHSVKLLGGESNFRQSDGTNYWEWNIDVTLADGTAIRPWGVGGSLSNGLHYGGFAGYEWAFSGRTAGDPNRTVFTLTTNADLSTFAFNGSGSFSENLDVQRNLKMQTSYWYRSDVFPFPTTDYERWVQRWSGTEFQLGTEAGGTGTANRPFALYSGTNQAIYFYGNGIDMQSLYRNWNFGNPSGNVAIKSTDGELTLQAQGSGTRRVILSPPGGQAVLVNSGLLRLTESTAGVDAQLSGGANDAFAFGAQNEALASFDVGIGAVNAAFGGRLSWLKGTNGGNLHAYGTNNTIHATMTGAGVFGFRGPLFATNLTDSILYADASGQLNEATAANVVSEFSGTPDGTKFLRDDGTLAVPAGGGFTGNANQFTTANGTTNISIGYITTNANFRMTAGNRIVFEAEDGLDLILITNDTGTVWVPADFYSFNIQSTTAGAFSVDENGDADFNSLAENGSAVPNVTENSVFTGSNQFEKIMLTGQVLMNQVQLHGTNVVADFSTNSSFYWQATNATDCKLTVLGLTNGQVGAFVVVSNAVAAPAITYDFLGVSNTWPGSLTQSTAPALAPLLSQWSVLSFERSQDHVFGYITTPDSTNTASLAATTVGTGLWARTSDNAGAYRTLTGTANEVSVANGDGVSGNPTVSLPATIDLGGKTSLEIPNAAAPTTDAFGEIAGDNDAWAASRGAVQFFDGTANTFLIGTLVSDTPSNGQVPKWNTGGTITWEDDATGAGAAVPFTNAVIARGDANSTNVLFMGPNGLTYSNDPGDQIRISQGKIFNQVGSVFDIQNHDALAAGGGGQVTMSFDDHKGYNASEVETLDWNLRTLSGAWTIDGNTTVNGNVVANGFSYTTNSWTKDGPIYMGTNTTFTSGATTCGITGVGGTLGSTEVFGQITIKSTGDIVFTNHVDFYTSDGLDSRTFTNANLTTVLVQVIPGFSTNMVFSWSK